MYIMYFVNHARNITSLSFGSMLTISPYPMENIHHMTQSLLKNTCLLFNFQANHEGDIHRFKLPLETNGTAVY